METVCFECRILWSSFDGGIFGKCARTNLWTLDKGVSRRQWNLCIHCS